MPSTDQLYPDLPFDSRVTRTTMATFAWGLTHSHQLLEQLVPTALGDADVLPFDDLIGCLPKEHWATKELTIFDITVPSRRVTGYRHAVAARVDHRQRTILYQDPQGDPADPDLMEDLLTVFSGYRYEDSPLKQQRDLLSCTWISFANMTAWLERKPLDPQIQDNLDDFKLRILGALRVLWPEASYRSLARAHCHAEWAEARPMKITDPAELPAFQHLAQQDTPVRPTTIQPAVGIVGRGRQAEMLR